MSTRKYPCPCEKGEHEEITKSDDWGNNRDDAVMLCPDCEGKYIWKDFITTKINDIKSFKYLNIFTEFAFHLNIRKFWIDLFQNKSCLKFLFVNN